MHRLAMARCLMLGLAVSTLAAQAGCGWAEWPPRGSPSNPHASGAGTEIAAADHPYAVQRPPAVRVTELEAPTPKPAPVPPDAAAPQAAAPQSAAPQSAAPEAAAPGAGGGADTADIDVVVRVEPGDTVYALSRRYGAPTRAIIDANRLEPPFVLRVGQPIVIPRRREHVVLRGETLYSVSRTYDIAVAALAAENGLIAPYHIRVGQRLTLPRGETGASQPTAARADGGPGQPAVPRTGVAAPPVEASGPLAPPPARAGSRFAWPVDGRIISSFGPKRKGLHNDGINIAAARGTPVRAAENGVVAYAGNELRGFGNLILLRHADGWVSAYAHNDELLVRRGDIVRRGQVIAKVGSSGGVSSAQLHFQLRRGKTAVDPRDYLAPRES